MKPRKSETGEDGEMPIRAENKSLYPSNWDEISDDLKHEVGWCCEWCPAEHGEPHPETGSIVILTTAHLDHNPANCERKNLKVLCQKCHNKYDRPVRQLGMKNRKRDKIEETQETLKI